jgi:hypothetical protein
MAIKRVTFDEIKNLRGSTKKEDLAKLKDHEINEAALADQDSAVPSDKDLSEFKRVGVKDKPRGKQE